MFRCVIWKEMDRSGVTFKPEVVLGTKIPFPGFPSMNVLPMNGKRLEMVGLNCFGTESKYENTILQLAALPPNLPPIATLAQSLVGKSIFVNWPMMHEAKVSLNTQAT